MIELFKRDYIVSRKVHELRSFIRACRRQMAKLDRANLVMASAEHDADEPADREAYGFAYSLIRDQWCQYSRASLDAINELKRRCMTCDRCADKAVAVLESDLAGFVNKPAVKVVETQYGWYEPKCHYCSTPDEPGRSYNDGLTVCRLVTYEFPEREPQIFGQLTGILNPPMKKEGAA